MKTLSSFSQLVANYPDKHGVPAKSLLDEIGGQVRRVVNDGMNTCAIRICHALNRTGNPIQRIPGLYQLEGAPTPTNLGTTGKGADLYILRVPHMKTYLERTYGPGRLIYDASKNPRELSDLNIQSQGLIVFIWSGPFRGFGASGHVDLFRLWPNADQPPRLTPVCASECYWWTKRAPMRAYLWETLP